MSYIRGALPFLIYNPHTRDDILPDGIHYSFELSQEVPGGYESNVQVIRREFKSSVVVQGCTSIAFNSSTSKITCTVPAIAAALSLIKAGDVLRVQGAGIPGNNRDWPVDDVVYDGSSVSITIHATLQNEAAGSPITIIRRFFGPWEVLEPETDYTIEVNNDGLYKQINFTKVPQEADVIYVMHRGEATYNFVPTEKSVGPEQLQDNLRSFTINVFVGDDETTDFVLSQDAPSAKTLEVSIDGILKYGSDPLTEFIGDFDLLDDLKTIRFAVAPPLDSKIYIRHLGFSTVMRRKGLSPNQVGELGPGAVNAEELANASVIEPKIATGAVTNTKIQANAVSGSKILLRNDEWLNWSGGGPSTPVGVLKIDSSNLTTLRSSGGPLSLNVADSKVFKFATTSISDATSSGDVDLGTSSHKFKDAHLSGSLNSSNANLLGNLSVAGTTSLSEVLVNGKITITGTIDNVDISDLQAQVRALAELVAQNTPAGSIKMWANNTAPPPGYLLCDGGTYSTTAYPDLFISIGYSFGGSGSTFNVPDFQGRFPLGKTQTGTGSGWGSVTGRGGSLDHTHETPAHTHGLANHIHSIPAHFHGMGNGATLNIFSSGDHTTSISHSHGSLTTGGGTAHSHKHSLTADLASHTHAPATFTSFGTSTSLAHSHTGTTNATDLNHRHFLNANSGGYDVADSNTSTVAYSADSTTFTRRRNTSAPISNTTGDDISKDLNHTHTFTTSNSSSLDHNHSIQVGFTNDGSHSHSITGTINDESAHTHTVNIPFLSAISVSSGIHKHDAENFSGVIGNFNSGANGDGPFSSGPPSPNTTDSGGVSTTGSSNPAFQTINFIIKT